MGQSVLNIAMAILGLGALAWAAASGQFQGTEDAKYTVDGVTVDAAARPPRSSRRRVLTGIVLVAVFASIAGSVALTVVAASSKTAPPGSSAPAKCPFQ